MQIISKMSKFNNLADNNIVSGCFPTLNNSQIIFYGSNNLLICEEGVTLEDSIIEFGANNSIIYLCKNRFNYKINIKVFNDSNVLIGSNNYFNQTFNAIVSGGTNLVIGSDCMFSFGIYLATSDHHLIYDIDSLDRINYSKSVFIGDHVWIGQQSTILKGSKIDSGSIIGASTVVANNHIEHNSCYAGNPARCIRNGVVWDGASIHKWTSQDTKKYVKYDKFMDDRIGKPIDEYIYEFQCKDSMSYEEIEKKLSCSSLKERANQLTLLACNNSKNKYSHLGDSIADHENYRDTSGSFQRIKKDDK